MSTTAQNNVAVDVVSRAGVVSTDPTLVSTEHPDHSSEGDSAVDVVTMSHRSLPPYQVAP